MSTNETADLETQPEAQNTENRTEVRIASQQSHTEQYDSDGLPSIPGHGIYQRFLRGLIRETEINGSIGSGRILDSNRHDTDEPGALLVFPDESRVFLGEDVTAHNRGDFGFVVKPNEPVPLPETVDEALDLLKPLGVRSHLEDTGELPPRQGEWWLLETDREPTSKVFKGGVSKRPFAGSPLENHVPTEFGFGVKADVLFSWFQSEWPEIVMEGDDLQSVLKRMCQAAQIEELEHVEPQYERPSFDELREAAEGVFIRGTLRHRDRDHYMERIGEDWKLARTHGMEVYTPDNTDMPRIVRRD